MSKLPVYTHFTVYKPGGVDVVRSGTVLLATDADKQAVNVGETVIVGVKADPIEDKIIEVEGRPQVVKRAAADIAARRPAPADYSATTDQTSVLIEALRTKGLVNDADMNSARDGMKAKAKPPAR